MPDYIYLFENRLSADQQRALKIVRDTARDAQMITFLTGAPVRDLTSGSPVRELNVTLQGNPLKLKKDLEKAGVDVWGEDETSRTLFLNFPGNVRLELSNARTITYPKPGKPSYEWSNILDDLKARDFTCNAMAVSLNEGSFGLLMDPLNGIADLEHRTLRLVSNYGFLDDSVRLITATRLQARLGFLMDDKTRTRYDNAKAEENIADAMSSLGLAGELEQIGFEEDPLRVMRALEAEGWMGLLSAVWNSSKADVAKLEELHNLVTQFQILGLYPDSSAAQMQLLTAKMQPKDLAALKSEYLQQGFVREWESLDELGKEFSKQLLAKENAAPSATWKLITSYDPKAVLWLAFTSKTPAVREKYNKFFNEWPTFKSKVPYALMAEMRIKPGMAGFEDLIQQIFLLMLDGKLATDEEIKAFLEPHAPPAPPPPVVIRRQRGRKAAEKTRARVEEDDDEVDDGEDDRRLDREDEDGDLGIDAEDEESESPIEDDEDVEDEDEEPVKPRTPVKTAKVKPEPPQVVKAEPRVATAVPAKAASVKPAAVKPIPAKTVQAKAAPKAPEPKPAVGKKPAAAPAKSPTVKAAPAKAAAKVEVKPAGKAPAKKPASKPVPTPAKKAVPVKPVAAKNAAKPTPSKPAAKPVKKAQKPGAKSKGR